MILRKNVSLQTSMQSFLIRKDQPKIQFAKPEQKYFHANKQINYYQIIII